jgi:glyoxylase-like metal-dependent hydrolase (beta-lactamase superfamily II)
VRRLRAVHGSELPDGGQRSDWELPDDYLPDRATLTVGDRELRAIHTPGHTRGHLVFHDAANTVLFAGDHVLPTITPSIGLEPVPSRLPLSDYLVSLQLIREMPDARLLPAHGATTDSVHDRVEQLLEHHAHRLDLTLAAVRSGASTAYEVAGRIGWTRRERRLDDLDLFNAMLAVMETVAHLDVLAETGRLTRQATDGVVHYSI